MPLSQLHRVAHTEFNDLKTATDEAGNMLKEDGIYIFKVLFQENQELF
jgi:hypothetical protein